MGAHAGQTPRPATPRVRLDDDPVGDRLRRAAIVAVMESADLWDYDNRSAVRD
jgi:hypothetical protein